MDTLKPQFPNLADSIIGVALLSNNNDIEKTKLTLQQWNSDEPSEDRIKSILAELGTFTEELGDETVTAILRENKWDADVALLPLFHKLEEHKQQKRAKDFESTKEVERRKKTQQHIQDLFEQVPAEKIQQILDENDWDMNAAIDEIMIYRANLEKEQKIQTERAQQLEQQRLRDIEADRTNKIEALVVRYGTTEVQTREILEKHNWDVDAAISIFVEIDQERKVKQFTSLYPGISEDEIRHIVQTTSNIKEAGDRIILLKKQKKAAEEKLKQEEEERKRKEETERLRKEEEEKRRSQEEEEAKRSEQARLLYEQKRKEEEERKAIEEERLRREEEERIERKRQEELKKKEEDEKKKAEIMNQKILDASIVVNIDINNKKEHMNNFFREELDYKLRETVPVVTNQQSLKAPFDEKEKEKEKEKETEKVEVNAKPATETNSLTSSKENKEYTVQLQISPSRVDWGKPINVDWEHKTSDPTTRDWIALFLVGNSGRQYYTYEWVSQKKGSVSFNAPEISGSYYVVYFKNSSYEILGVSEHIYVGPQYEISGAVVNNTQVIDINLLSSTPAPQAWVAMYSSSDADLGNYYTYQWVEGRSSLTFDIPKVGTWYFKFFPQKAYYSITSCSVTTTGTNTLELLLSEDSAVVKYSIKTLDTTRDGVWVGIYFIDQGNQRMYRRKKVLCDNEGSVSVKKMCTPGTYEARLFGNGTFEVLLKSSPITID